MNDITTNALAEWRVLIVEDAPDNAELVARTLRHFGAQITMVSNGAEALIELNKGDFKLIICDLSMPILDGWELIKQMRQLERTKHSPVVALTAHAMDEDRVHAMEAGFDGYYAKPIEDVLHLVSYLMQVVGSDQKVSSD